MNFLKKRIPIDNNRIGDMTLKKKIIRYTICCFLILICFGCIYFYLNSGYHLARMNGIDHIITKYCTPPSAGPHLTTVIGEDKEGQEVAIWIKRSYYFFNSRVVYKEYLKNGISKEEVLDILKEENLNNTSEQPLLIHLPEGVGDDLLYWVVHDVENRSDEEYLVVNFYTGKIAYIGRSE